MTLIVSILLNIHILKRHKEYNNGFYVYAKPDNISSIKQTIDYVVR